MEKQGFSPAAVITIVILVALLGWAAWYAVGAWTAMRGVHMSPLGWLFMILGVVVTFLLGAGLMALVFYSSRHDMDRCSAVLLDLVSSARVLTGLFVPSIRCRYRLSRAHVLSTLLLTPQEIPSH